MHRRAAALVAIGADAAAVAVTWSRLPERAPVHWDFYGRPDRYGSRMELVLLGPFLIVGTWLLLEVIRLVDPRWLKRAPVDPEATRLETEGARETIESLLLGLMALLHLAVLLLAAGAMREPLRLLALFFAAFLVVLGNFIGRVRPNWFIGIRTPWTLSSDEVWRLTHRMAAKAMVGAGLLLVPLGLALPERAVLPVSVAVLLAAVLLPAAWSYALWRAEKQDT
ncbi:MAG TPA: SdpI family protein [Myxococcales bacterium]|nr:SdpI family protein [Myxococcales bacterium]